MKRSFFGLLILCLMLPLGVAAQAKNPQWTIIYYSAADTDLEQFMIGDLMEMQIVGSSKDVNVVVQMDRIEGFDDTDGNWTDARRFLLQKGDPNKPSNIIDVWTFARRNDASGPNWTLVATTPAQ